MATLTDFIPAPRIREHDEVSTVASAPFALELARHFDLARSPLVHALFWLRTIPERLNPTKAGAAPLDLHLDAIGRSGEGFTVLEDSPDRLIVGAIGRFWRSDIPFARVEPSEFAGFAEPGWGKVAWALSCEPDPGGSRVCIDLAVTATDDEAWRKLERYLRFLLPFSRFIRRHELQIIARDLGGERDLDAQRWLAGDEWVPVPKAAATDGTVIDAPPSAVWPWLVQIGGRRAGWYSHDLLDNGGVRSAGEIISELQQLRVGDVIPATPRDRGGFTVLQLTPPNALVLGGMFDTERDCPLSMNAPKPEHYWRSSWAFVLEPLAEERTRLWVRARVDYAPDRFGMRLRARTLALIHHFMESAQLEHVKARAEGRDVPPAATAGDVVEGAAGAAGMLFNLATPFLRNVRCHWGLTRAEAERSYPGDHLVPEPRWQWSHAIEVRAPREEVWPWIAQLGQDKGGFYSYQALENLVGCEIRNAERVHPEWQSPKTGDALRLHPNMPPLIVREAVPNEHLLVCAGMDPVTGVAPAGDAGTKFVAVSWLFQLEALANGHTRLISRYRCACSGDLATRIAYGPYIAEAIGFVMDRRMLIGIRDRAESSAVTSPAELHAPATVDAETPVEAIMHRDPIAVREHDTLIMTAARMATARVRHACVVDAEGCVVGIISDRDVRHTLGDVRCGLVPDHVPEHLHHVSAAHVMMPKPQCVQENTPMREVLSMLLEPAHLGALPVVDESGRLRGIVSYVDLLRVFAGMLDDRQD